MNDDLISQLIKQVNNLQLQVDGLIKPEVGRWIDWTPTVTQNVAVTVTVDRAKYFVLGDLVTLYADLAVTSAGTAANSIVIGNLPIAINGFRVNLTPMGVALIFDSGVSGYLGFPIPTSSTTLTPIDTVTRTNIGVNPNFALANGDYITFRAFYKR